MLICTSRKIVPIVANRKKSKSSDKEMLRQAKLAFFISNVYKNRVSVTRIWNRVMNFGTGSGPGTRFLLQITMHSNAQLQNLYVRMHQVSTKMRLFESK